MIMSKEYVVTVLSLDTNKIFTDVFMATSEGGTRHSFNECYRHGNYKILSAVPTGRYWYEQIKAIDNIGFL